MDQLKEFLGVLRRQHFWFIAPLLLVIGLVGWMMANKKLTAEFEADKAQVNAYIQQMQSVSSQQPHPNPDYHRGMEQLIAQRQENVRAAWARKWERQKQELKWPEGLPAELISLADQMRPIEKEAASRPALSSILRRQYASFIDKELPKLAERIGAKWNPSNVGRTGELAGLASFRPSTRPAPGGPRTEAEDEEGPGLVEWDRENQGQIAARFDWGGDAPDTFEVLYAQEDLWVLTTLVDIIQRTNGDAMIQSQAAIKRIEFIKIGKDVDPPSKQGFQVVRPMPLTDEEATGDSTAADSSPMPADSPAEDETTADEETTTNATDAELLVLVKNRYYDMNYEPITDIQSPSLKVAKRIPVRMRVRMDQRKINDLLVQCANSPLTFEVRQLRFNPQGGPDESGRQERAAFAQTDDKTLAEYESLDRTVELFGIVYIFNPVDDSVLGGELGEEAAPADDAEAGVRSDRRFLGLAATSRESAGIDR
jgi:hypothetical protein